MNKLKLYDTLSKNYIEFKPIDDQCIKMYVCGPTVYSYAHIGNARSVVVFDLLYRILKYLYKDVLYIRNITDVDDKIIKAARQENKTINDITTFYTNIFHEDIANLNCLPPNNEPKATEYIQDMINVIKVLIDNGYAYFSNKHVYFKVKAYNNYGMLSKKNIDDLIAGSRVEISKYKQHPGDFVLWKPAAEGDRSDSYWDSPWGIGRPGWHIECSVMSNLLLGADFDIHGGGADLKFPHHENEIAQSICAVPNSGFAKYWVHNDFITVNGEKMSKSLGNIVTINGLLHRHINGEVIRYALLSTHYRKKLDWNENILNNARKFLDKLYNAINVSYYNEITINANNIDSNVINALLDDMNTHLALLELQNIVTLINKNENDNDADKKELIIKLVNSASVLGLLTYTPDQWFCMDSIGIEIQKLINKRVYAKKQKDFITADKIRNILKEKGINLLDLPNGNTKWSKS